MRYIIVLFTALIMGQMVGYLGSALSHTAYSPMTALIGSLILTLVVYIIGEMVTPAEEK